MPLGMLSRGSVARSSALPSSVETRQTPRLSSSQDTTETYRLPWRSGAIPVTASKNGPHKVSGGPIGSSARVDCVPSAAIFRISPVKARLMYVFPATSMTMLSGVSN